MEAQTTAPATTPAPATAPAPEVANVTYQAPTPQMETGGAIDAITKPKMNVKDILLSGFLFAMTISVIIYTRLAIAKLKEQPTTDEIDDMSGDIEEVKFNLQKAMGKKYQKT
jgi:hypothetical protein